MWVHALQIHGVFWVFLDLESGRVVQHGVAHQLEIPKVLHISLCKRA